MKNKLAIPEIVLGTSDSYTYIYQSLNASIHEVELGFTVSMYTEFDDLFCNTNLLRRVI